MKDWHVVRSGLVVVGVTLIMCALLAGNSYGQFQQGQKNLIGTNEKGKVQGVILTRDGETFVVRNMERMDTTVVLTDTTKVRTERKGLFRGHKPYDVTVLIPGLILEVEGMGDMQGRLVAEDITFSEADLKSAITSYVQSAPVNQQATQNRQQIAQTQQQLAATKEQLAVTNMQLSATDQTLADTSKEVVATNKRISNLDKYDVVKVVTVLFGVNSDKLTDQAKAQLDEVASRAPGAKNYMVEVKGYTDPTGNFDKNLELSQRRADAVVQYLTVKWNIPLRRISVPMGFGQTTQVGNANTAAGRAQDRRVEVSILFNKGLNE